MIFSLYFVCLLANGSDVSERNIIISRTLYIHPLKKQQAAERSASVKNATHMP